MDASTTLFIPVEIKHRELYSKILLAMYAAERGFRVLLGRKSELNQLAMHMEPGIYYGLGTVKNNASFYSALARRGNLIAVSDEEGLITFSDEMYLDLKVAPETLDAIDLLFTWGVENHRVLAQGRPVTANRLRITGNPRFDLLKEPFKRIYDPEIRQIRGSYSRFVLLCTSFGSCNHYIREIDYVQSLIEKKVLVTQRDIDAYRRFQQCKLAGWKAFVDSVPLLARAYPDIQFVIRPHPSEHAAPYQDLADQIVNVHLESRFSIHAWLLAAEALVHHYCTSAVEAFAAGTPSFALRPIRDTSVEKEIPYECSRECASPGELVDAMQTVLLNTADVKLQLIRPVRPYSDYVFNMGDSVASELIVEELVASRDRRDSVSGAGDPQLPMSVTAIALLKRYVSPLLSRNWKNQQYVSHKMDCLIAKEVRIALATFASERGIHLRCRQAGNQIVSIERDHYF
jgi:surface carbohydrate biosynthesis protein